MAAVRNGRSSLPPPATRALLLRARATARRPALPDRTHRRVGARLLLIGSAPHPTSVRIWRMRIKGEHARPSESGTQPVLTPEQMAEPPPTSLWNTYA